MSSASRPILALVSLAALLAAACSSPEAPAPAEEAAAATHASEIDWHRGDVAEAFELARTSDKPIFLYWGAVWCPPCNQVKATIFTRPEFVETTRHFVPVYLDGDTESAQIWGERFAVQGYPTMIVLDPQGSEITRIPGGIDIEAFASVLDDALERMRPVDELLRAAVEGTEELAPADYRLLAYHSWFQDEDPGLPEAELSAAFRTLWKRTPDAMAVEKTRFLLHYLALAADEEETAIPDADRAEAVAALETILADSALTRGALDYLLYGAADYVGALTDEGSPERDRLVAAWEAALGRLAEDPAISTDERLSTWIARLDLFDLLHPETEAPEELREGVAAAVAEADRSMEDLHERQAVVPTAGYLLRRVGMTDEARALLVAELDRSESPYYFMSSLASLADKEGKTDEAVDWLRRAWESSDGRATRFQWGVQYLSGLMELVPEDSELIESESRRVLSEVVTHDDAFYGRNHGRMQRLEKAFSEWNEDGTHTAVLEAIRATVTPSCAELPAEGERAAARERCEAFLAAQESA